MRLDPNPRSFCAVTASASSTTKPSINQRLCAAETSVLRATHPTGHQQVCTSKPQDTNRCVHPAHRTPTGVYIQQQETVNYYRERPQSRVQPRPTGHQQVCTSKPQDTNRCVHPAHKRSSTMSDSNVSHSCNPAHQFQVCAAETPVLRTTSPRRPTSLCGSSSSSADIASHSAWPLSTLASWNGAISKVKRLHSTGKKPPTFANTSSLTPALLLRPRQGVEAWSTL